MWITLPRIVDDSPPIVENSVENPVENPESPRYPQSFPQWIRSFPQSFPHRNPRSLAGLIKHSVGRQKLQFEFKIAPLKPPNLSTAGSK